MPARLRLRRGSDFQRVYSARHGRHGNLMVVHWRDNQLEHPRIGYSVSTKVGGSVQRNLVKRRLRELARPLLLASARGVDVVVVARPAALAAPFPELRAEFGAMVGAVLVL
jgi:ribonuclease P protein component